MRATARVDPSLCRGAGSCEAMGPGLFRIADDGHAQLLPRAVGGDDLALLEDIARCCPAGAITVTIVEEGVTAPSRRGEK